MSILTEPNAPAGKRRKKADPNAKGYLEKYDKARREVTPDRWVETIARLPQAASVYLRGIEKFTDATGKTPVESTRPRDVRIHHNRGRFVVVRGEDASTSCDDAGEALAKAIEWSGIDYKAVPAPKAPRGRAAKDEASE